MSTADAPQYTVREGDAVADRATVLGIWAGNLGQDARMPAKYDWFYLQSPLGAPLLQLLQHGEHAAGTCAAGLREFAFGERRLRAGVLVDLAVLPEHRSLGPALMLQQGLVAASDRQQIDLLYGFPNPKAAPVFKRMGYIHAADMVRHVRILRHTAYLRRHVPGWLAHVAGALLDATHAVRDRVRNMGRPMPRVVLHDAVDEQMQALCSQHPLPGAVTSRRSLAYLQWRLDRAPQGSLRYASIHAAGDARMLAWACWRDDGHVATVLDFWSETPEHGFPPACIHALCGSLRRAGHDSVQVEMATSPSRRANWLACRFVARGARPLFLRWRAPPGTDIDMHFTSADEDE